jgi:hypothetical protein
MYPGTMYIPELEMCLTLPQSWCQSANENFPKNDGTWQYQTAESFVMEWDQCKFRRTVPWDRHTNTGILQSAPGNKHYRVFAAVHDIKQECSKNEHVAYEAAHVIPDDRTQESCDSSQERLSLGAEEEDPPPTYPGHKRRRT